MWSKKENEENGMRITALPKPKVPEIMETMKARRRKRSSFNIEELVTEDAKILPHRLYIKVFKNIFFNIIKCFS